MSSVYDFSTPMMQQYMQLKAAYADCMVLFRLGDFYELFLEDAEIGAKVLGIVLTRRSRGKDGDIPMAGIPYHALDSYLHKLVSAGFKIAIAEQLSAPNGKTLVERSVVRVVTPGTIVEEGMLEAKQATYLMAVEMEKKVGSYGAAGGGAIGIALCDLSTGELRAGEWRLPAGESYVTLLSDLVTLYPAREVIISPTIFKQPALLEPLKTACQPAVVHLFSEWETHTSSAKKTIVRAMRLNHLDAFELAQQPLAQKATAALMGYLAYTQKKPLLHFTAILSLHATPFLKLDRSAIAHLELIEPLRNDSVSSRPMTLCQTIDKTVTAAGGRLLKSWLLKPLINQDAIENRLNQVQLFVERSHWRHEVRHHLKHLGDLERMVARLSLQQIIPKELKQLETSLRLIDELITSLPPTLSGRPWEQLLAPVLLSSIKKLHLRLRDVLIENPPTDLSKGGCIKKGVSDELDQLHLTVARSQEVIAQIEKTEREQSGISSLKIKFNSVFGFYIEVSKANLHLVPSHFWRKQTLVNAERFITPELKVQEEIVLKAEAEIVAIETQVYHDLVAEMLAQAAVIQEVAQLVAEVDVVAALAEQACLAHYTRPHLSTTGELEIRQGRHPVVEHTLSSSTAFVPNDVSLNPTTHQTMILTGPNMAGKSVLMRQTALITILAHVGSFVPAERATISLCDQVFVRSGASDMITAGLSTFMVEMVETAYILRHATPKSLIIMDEIGRGTSTYDGISIAWAVAESLVQGKTGPKTLFATHYHELQALAERYPQRISNYHLAITEHHGKPVFLYQLKPGGASHSFGIAVAELAGIPDAVVQAAQAKLATLEQPTFTLSDKTIKTLEKVNPNTLTPLAALELITEWKKQLA